MLYYLYFQGKENWVQKFSPFSENFFKKNKIWTMKKISLIWSFDIWWNKYENILEKII